MGIAEHHGQQLGIVIRDPSHAFLADRALLGFDHAIGLLFSKYNSEYMQLEVWGATAPLAAVIDLNITDLCVREIIQPYRHTSYRVLDLERWMQMTRWWKEP